MKDRLELTQTVPELDAGIAMHVPGFPGNIRFVEGGGLRVARVGDKRQATGFGDSVDEGLRIVCQGSDVPGGVEDQQMILLWHPVLVMDFLTDQEQDAAAADSVVSLQPLNQHVVICHNDRVQSRFDGSIGDLLMGPRPIGVTRVHVQIDDDFVHDGLCRQVYR
jgi:hypothetical protein